MEAYVGTSGWMYTWNKGKTLDWYLENSGLNSVELNASYYKFPFPNQVKSWASKGNRLRWAIKVNRLMTHLFKFNDNALSSWEKFKQLFEPLDTIVDFYLFQIPPSLKPSIAPRLERFIKKTKLASRFALEVRNIGWFDEKWVTWASSLGITLVSIDSPDFPLDVFNTSGVVYERVHGRQSWYCHRYTVRELGEIAQRILSATPTKIYVYFNNDSDMIGNARMMMDLLRQKS